MSKLQQRHNRTPPGVVANNSLPAVDAIMRNPEADREAEESWSQAEQDLTTKQRREQRQARLEEETNPRRKTLHKFFLLISVLSGISAFLMGLGQFLGVFLQTVDAISYVLRIYVIALCLLVILVELEWTRSARESFILKNWITRGLAYSFIGVLGLEENDKSAFSKNTDDLRGFDVVGHHYIDVIAWIMVGCGALYTTMGIFCLQLIYNRLRNDYQERLARAPSVRHAAETYGAADENPV